MDFQKVFEKQIQPQVYYDGTCWSFMGSTKNGMHGNVKVGGRRGKTMYTHRIAYELFNGPIPEGAMIMHLCNNSRCCHPAHLKAGTQTENMQYNVECGRKTGRPRKDS